MDFQKRYNIEQYRHFNGCIKKLIAKSLFLNKEKFLQELQIIENDISWSYWGNESHKTKHELVKYINTLKLKCLQLDNTLAIQKTYLLDEDLKSARKKIHKAYMSELKE